MSGNNEKGFDIAQLKRDKKKAEDGVWVDVGGGLKIQVVSPRASSTYKSYLLKNSGALRRGLERGNVNAEKAEELTRKSYAKHILLDWNLEEKDDAGKLVTVPCTEANRLRIFKEAPEFLEMVIQEATDDRNFRLEDDDPEADAKN